MIHFNRKCSKTQVYLTNIRELSIEHNPDEDSFGSVVSIMYKYRHSIRNLLLYPHQCDTAAWCYGGVVCFIGRIWTSTGTIFYTLHINGYLRNRLVWRNKKHQYTYLFMSLLYYTYSRNQLSQMHRFPHPLHSISEYEWLGIWINDYRYTAK